jgi:hypothetical protein
MAVVASDKAPAGKRAGARRGPRKRASVNRGALGLALAITVLVVAWGYLVKTAVDFGSAARGGEGSGWGFLALACAGAAACLFVGLILVAKLLRKLGITSGASEEPEQPEAAHGGGGSTGGGGTRDPGGHRRAAR